MKWQARDLTAALRQDPVQWPPIILIYGEDAGQISQFAKQLVSASGIDPQDTFAAETVSLEQLQENSGALLEAATTLGFGATRKLVRLTGMGGQLGKDHKVTLTSALLALDEASLQDVLVICPIPGLDASSKLIKTLEKSSQAATLRCYQERAQDLRRTLSDWARNQQKTLAPDAEAFLLDNLGNDRQITTNELEKLAFYTADRADVTLADCLAVLAAAPSVNIFKLCDAIGERNKAQTLQLLELLWQEGNEAQQVLNLVVWHLQRLRQYRELLSAGKTSRDALFGLKPPVRFNQDNFIQQAERYPATRLNNLTTRALAIQAQSRQGVTTPEHSVERAILALAA